MSIVSWEIVIKLNCAMLNKLMGNLSLQPNQAIEAVPNSFRSDIREGFSKGMANEVFAFYLVYAQIKKAYLYQCSLQEITPFELGIINKLGLYITSGDNIFVSKTPLNVPQNLSHTDIAKILGFQCVNDFGSENTKSISVQETTTSTFVVSEVCKPENVTKSVLAYYNAFVRNANFVFKNYGYHFKVVIR